MNKRKGVRELSSKMWGIALSVPWLGLISACSVATPATGALPTVAVTRGDTALDVAAIGHATNASAETIVRREFVETLQPMPGGIEQSWTFDHAPGSTGDLTITVDASGLEYMTTSSDGIEFQQTGAFEVQYGHGTWVDASGTRTGIPARFDRERIVLTVPAAVVNVSKLPASLSAEKKFLRTDAVLEGNRSAIVNQADPPVIKNEADPPVINDEPDPPVIKHDANPPVIKTPPTMTTPI